MPVDCWLYWTLTASERLYAPHVMTAQNTERRAICGRKGAYTMRKMTVLETSTYAQECKRAKSAGLPNPPNPLKELPVVALRDWVDFKKNGGGDCKVVFGDIPTKTRRQLLEEAAAKSAAEKKAVDDVIKALRGAIEKLPEDMSKYAANYFEGAFKSINGGV